MSWMKLPEEYSPASSKFVILPLLYEKNLTYGDGASLGPLEIIKASEHLEYYDEQFDSEAFLKGIRLLSPLALNDVEPTDMVEMVSKAVKENVSQEQFLIGLGGDHSVTIGVARGLEQVYGNNFSVIQFDAHADLFHSWNGSEYNHRCTAQRISLNHELVLVGVRSMDVDEKKIIDNNETIHLIKAYEYSLDRLKGVLPQLKDNVFITIDVDVFDPSFIRNTGTPEPGGMVWNQLIEALALIFKEKKVIGCDIAEFAPKVHYESEAYALAKLVYKVCNLHVISDKKSNFEARNDN